MTRLKHKERDPNVPVSDLDEKTSDAMDEIEAPLEEDDELEEDNEEDEDDDELEGR